MKILIIGNIGCGKTTIGKKLSKILGYKFIQIDDIRSKVLKNKKVSLEYLSLYLFIKSIEENNNIIAEFTGAGCHKYAIKRALELSGDRTIVVICKINNVDLLKERIKYKVYDYESPFNIEIDHHIEYIQREIEDAIRSNFWCGEKIKQIVIELDEKEINDVINEILNIILFDNMR